MNLLRHYALTTNLLVELKPSSRYFKIAGYVVRVVRGTFVNQCLVSAGSAPPGGDRIHFSAASFDL